MKPQSMLILSLIAVVIAMMAVSTFLLFYGREATWRVIAAEADLGSVSFDGLRRRWQGNDALVCPPDRCGSEKDIAAPQFQMPLLKLRIALGKAIASEELLSLVDVDDLIPEERYVQRSKFWRFPDTIVVRYYALPEGRSTLALYSRSQLGLSDFGVNKARLMRWLERLNAEVAKEG